MALLMLTVTPYPLSLRKWQEPPSWDTVLDLLCGERNEGHSPPWKGEYSQRGSRTRIVGRFGDIHKVSPPQCALLFEANQADIPDPA